MTNKEGFMWLWRIIKTFFSPTLSLEKRKRLFEEMQEELEKRLDPKE